MLLRKMLLACVLSAMVSVVNAAPIEVNDRASLGANDFVDWGAFGPAFTLVPDGSTVNSVEGNTITVSNTIEPGTPFRVFQQVPPVVTGFWNGNFAPGDKVLAPNGRPGATLIQFSTPVFGAGAQIQGGSILNTPFTAVLDVTDIDGLLYSFSATGISTADADNSAIFLGVLNDVPNIVSIQYSISDLAPTDNGPGINRLDIRSVPAPNSLALFLTGILALWVGRQTFARVKSSPEPK